MRILFKHVWNLMLIIFKFGFKPVSFSVYNENGVQYRTIELKNPDKNVRDRS